MNSNRKQSIPLNWESYIFIFTVGREEDAGSKEKPLGGVMQVMKLGVTVLGEGTELQPGAVL